MRIKPSSNGTIDDPCCFYHNQFNYKTDYARTFILQVGQQFRLIVSSCLSEVTVRAFHSSFCEENG